MPMWPDPPPVSPAPEGALAPARSWRSAGGEPPWLGAEVPSAGVLEQVFTVACEDRSVPATLFSPAAASPPLPLILVGHGGREHKRSPRMLALGRLLARSGLAALAIDGPVHGDRASRGSDAAVVPRELARAFRLASLADHMVRDWQAALDAAQRLDHVGVGPVGYWGVCIGTIFGVRLLVAEPRIRAAVLGLMGALPRQVGSLAREAEGIAIPVLFLQQWGDELVPRARAFELFSHIGSQEKRLHAYAGRHDELPEEAFEQSERFLTSRLRRLSA